MTLDATIEQIARSAQNGTTGRALPPEAYLDEDFYALEVERIFRPGWHAIARKDELPNPGDYRALELVGEPLLLVRNEEGRLRLFSNICRHRAFPIAEGSGNAKRLVCTYHRWAYDLDGRLATAPLMDEVPGFDRAACGLPELPLEEWQGFVFATVNPEPEPLAPQLVQLEELIAPMDFGGFVEAGVLDFDSPWNWKVMVENFMESYHHQGAHAQTLQRSNPAKGTHAMDLEGSFIALENPGEPPFWVLQVFPTLLFALTRGEVPLATWYEMQIDRHDHFHLRIHVLLQEEHAGTDAIVDGIKEVLTEIHLEDIPMCEGIQRGLKSRLWQPGPLAVHERTLQQFHRYLAESLTS